MNVLIDKDIVDFLKTIYFGDYSDPIKAAGSRAYRDMNRTIRFHSVDEAGRKRLRKEVDSIFEEEIKKVNLRDMKSQEEFDFWHYSVCTRIKNIYRKAGIQLTYGQVQKWLNMTIKYLYMLEAYTFEDIFGWLHVPLDNYVFNIAGDELGVKRPKKAWSKWDDYRGEYFAYQKQLREKIGYEPLRWEFHYWLKEIQKNKYENKRGK